VALSNSRWIFLVVIVALATGLTFSGASAQDGPLKKAFVNKFIEHRKKTQANPFYSKEGLYQKGKGKSIIETVNRRRVIVYTPPHFSSNKHQLPLLTVLHGGFGNAAQIQNYSSFEPLADKFGFVVAYLDGTKVTSRLSEKFKGWNAGGCCGQSYKNGINDVKHISDVVRFIADKYGLDKRKVYGTGHSNGAMMTMRMVCETNIYKAAATYSGTLQMDIKTCPNASGTHILNIHGSEDANLPINGGHTKEGFNKETNYKSQEYTKSIFDHSGAHYTLLLLKGADHSPETLNGALWKTEGFSLPQRIFAEFGYK